MDENIIRERIKQILLVPVPPGDTNGQIRAANEILQGTLSLMAAVYSPESQQAASFLESVKSLRNDRAWSRIAIACNGALQNMEAELAAGFTGSLQKRMAGDVLTDFIQLARAILDNGGNGSKNVAAVLAAAAYEDTIRRMGSAFAGVVGRDDLNKVIDALKVKGVLVAPQLAIALSYLSFRNHALHADWEKIDLAAVHSLLGFVEQLLMKHFA